MSATEALRTQLDALQAECNTLKVENQRLRDEHPTQAKELDLEQELAETRGENICLLQTIAQLEDTLGARENEEAVATLRQSVTCEAAELKEELGNAEVKLAEERTMHAELQSGTKWAECRAGELEDELQHVSTEAELRELRNVAEVGRKWEEREAIIVRRIEELEKEKNSPLELPPSPGSVREVRNVHFASREGVVDLHSDSGQIAPPALAGAAGDQTLSHSQHHEGDKQPSHTLRVRAPSFHPQSHPLATPSQGERLASTHLNTLSAVLLAQQLPPLPNFSGDQVEGEGETIDDWLERLELVAVTCHWEEQAKLVNVAARMRGSASWFYRSCTPQQRSSYASLTTALHERFTPVRLQSVQSRKFHVRRQQPKESVDNYAQDLRKLFHRAYDVAQDAGSGAEEMSRSALAYQFVAGLKDKLKSKLVGRSGSFEELLCKARFEEARLREMEASDEHTTNLPKTHHFQSSQHTKLPVLVQVQQPLVGVGVMEPTNLGALCMEVQRVTPVGEQVISAKIALLEAGDNRWRAIEGM